VLRGLCGAGGTADTLVATECGAVIGHAMAVPGAGPGGIGVVDIGLVVADHWQHRGIGSALLRDLLASPAARAASAAVMDVQAENRLVLGMIRRRWPDARINLASDPVTVLACLGLGGGGRESNPPVTQRATHRF